MRVGASKSQAKNTAFTSQPSTLVFLFKIHQYYFPLTTFTVNDAAEMLLTALISR